MCNFPFHALCGRKAKPANSNPAASEELKTSRRNFLEGAALTAFLGTLGAKAGGALIGTANAQTPARMLIKGGMIISVDKQVGDLTGDVLIENGRIAAIGPNLSADGAQMIDAGNRIVMPGFIDTHRHMWEGVIRNSAPDGTLLDYIKNVLGKAGPVYRPEDVYAGDLVAALGALDAGVTSILDWSHIQNTPEHSDAAVKALQESGIRAVFGYGSPQLGFGKKLSDNTAHKYPGDLRRLKTQYFASDDQLVTLALAANGPGFGSVDAALEEWKLAREVGVRISVHASVGFGGKHPFEELAAKGVFGPDTTYIHCSYMNENEWKLMADTGGTISAAAFVEMAMGLNHPVIQESLDHGIRPSLSVDVETSVPGDMFTQMRAAIAAQRDPIFTRTHNGEKGLTRISARDVLEFATLQGARANGMDKKTGSLTVGKQADIILLRADAINVMPVTDPVTAVVFGMDTSNVDTVIVGGKIKKQDGKLVGVDMKRVADLAMKSHQYVLEKSGLMKAG